MGKNVEDWIQIPQWKGQFWGLSDPLKNTKTRRLSRPAEI